MHRLETKIRIATIGYGQNAINVGRVNMSFNICIIKLGALGDVVRTTSLVPALLRKHPNAQITWITSPQAIPLLENDPDIRVMPIDDCNAWQDDYDWVISLDDNSSACMWATGLFSRKRSGVYWNRLGSRMSYTYDMHEWFDMGLTSEFEAEKANELKKANTRTMYEMWYDGLDLPRPIEKPRIYGSSKPYEPHNVNGRHIIGLNTQGGSRWKYKSWTADATYELAHRLISDGHYVVLMGGREEEQFNVNIARRIGAVHTGVVPSPTAPNCVINPADYDRPVTHWNVLDLNEVVKKLTILVTSDSLAMHLAVANNIPTVAFFGPTSAAEIDLFGNGVKLETALPCGRCYLHDCNVRPTCMDTLQVDEVYAAVQSLL